MYSCHFASLTVM